MLKVNNKDIKTMPAGMFKHCNVLFSSGIILSGDYDYSFHELNTKRKVYAAAPILESLH